MSFAELEHLYAVSFRTDGRWRARDLVAFTSAVEAIYSVFLGLELIKNVHRGVESFRIDQIQSQLFDEV